MAARLLALVPRASAAVVATSLVLGLPVAQCGVPHEAYPRLEQLEKRIRSLESRTMTKSKRDEHWSSEILVEGEPLFTETAIAAIVSSLAEQISRDYAHLGPNDEFVIVALMDGVFIFVSDLCRELMVSHSVDFITASSYGLGTVSSGNVKISSDTKNPVSGKHVLIVDEMCDSGRTLASLKDLMKQRGAASVKTCVLLDKVSRRCVEVRPNYVGAVCPDEFVVGYGMDWAGRYRSLPFIGVVKPELYRS